MPGRAAVGRRGGLRTAFQFDSRQLTLDVLYSSRREHGVQADRHRRARNTWELCPHSGAACPSRMRCRSELNSVLEWHDLVFPPLCSTKGGCKGRAVSRPHLNSKP